MYGMMKGKGERILKNHIFGVVKHILNARTGSGEGSEGRADREGTQQNTVPVERRKVIGKGLYKLYCSKI